MQSPGEMHKERVPKVFHSQSKLSDGQLTFKPSEEARYGSQNTIYPEAQSLGNDQSTSAELTRPRIKKEFPDENAQEIKTWDRFRPVKIKQEPNTRQQPGIKMETREFNDGQRAQHHLVIDLTSEENPSVQKRSIPRMELLVAVYQQQKAAQKATETAEHPVEGLFVQDDDSSHSPPPKTNEHLEPGEDDTSGFNDHQKELQSLQSPSMEQQVEFEKRRQKELERRRKVKLDSLCDLNVQAELEVPESDNISSSSLEEKPQPEEPQSKEQTKTDLKTPITVKLPSTRLSKSRMQRAKELGLVQLLSKEGTRKRGKADESEPQIQQVSGPRGNERKHRRPPTVLTTQEIRSIFNNDSGHKTGKDPLPPGFVSTERNKQKAFKEMLAIIPVAEKPGARADILLLDEATKTFNPSARSDGQGKWKIRGLKTSLMVNQILAASWMCKRETYLSKPNGGLLCDVMGFGKTLSALACIVNRKVPSEPEGPTLIVAPRNLIPTWMSQIRQHCVQGAAGSIIAHCSGAHVETDELAHHLKQHGIVLTTYHEISSSYPNLKPPPELRTDAAVREWWDQEYEKIGAFHQINWHRIVLDEAHIIRNRTTRTSIAVRALSGNFKWALTGTPLHNSVDELYTLFAFIGVPNSHPYHVFMHNFCDETEDAKDRLINMLRAVIHRKTHESRHMGRPLIELKKLDLRETRIDIYPVERQIYRAIVETFIEKVNECFDALGDEEGSTNGIARLCCACRIMIKKAAFYGLYDDFDTPPPEDAETARPTGQQKRPATPETRTEKEARTKKRRKGETLVPTFSEWLLADESLSAFDDESEHGSQDEERDISPDEDDIPCEEEEIHESHDWIAIFGKSMPGAKFDALTAQVKEWFENDNSAKIVIFTQYINSTRLLKSLCEVHGWKYSQMTGRMANRSREISLSNFRDDAETRIMIASIKTGGLGLDFSVANKCILIDLWWNEAVQDQAFFRLWRLGQQRDVECVMLMVKSSIDDWMDKTQKRKAKEISEVMSQNVLMDRNTLKELLEMFGEATEDPKKGFRVHLSSEKVSTTT
ncbi:hypothetical protein PENCOP_c002G01841 [Penicillium coprophilum]|uniref:Helicase ATP-binding domain-containing protein n=1 Tax=Penicillium coprophilum TaxID=36646 RepID=A0A1V6V0R8_9EURO|nr:hypothetical protein PENCOP_c002G01841 [Penicillium coprophilum]